MIYEQEKENFQDRIFFNLKKEGFITATSNVITVSSTEPFTAFLTTYLQAIARSNVFTGIADLLKSVQWFNVLARRTPKCISTVSI